MTLTTYIHAYTTERRRQGRMAPNTARSVRSILTTLARAHGNRPLTQLGPATIDRWLTATTHLRPATRRHQLSQVRVFCRWLHRRGLITRDPTRDVEPIRQPRHVDRTLDHDQIRALLAAAPDVRSRAVLWLLIGCGLRCIEVSRLSVEDWHRRDSTLLVEGKAGHERLVPVPRPVAQALDAYLLETGATAGPLIRSRNQPSAGIQAPTISTMVRGWCRAAGIKRGAYDGISAHAARHTYAHDLLDVAGDLRVVADALGHAHTSTTTRYVGRSKQAQIRSAVDARTERLAA